MASSGFRLQREDGSGHIDVSVPVVIGRAPDCDITINSPRISRKHLRVYVEDSKLWVADLKSTHGVFVNDQRITIPVALNPGDSIRVDTFRFIAVVEHAQDDETLVEPAPEPEPEPEPEPAPAVAVAVARDESGSPGTKASGHISADSPASSREDDDMPPAWVAAGDGTQAISVDDMKDKLRDAQNAPVRPATISTPILKGWEPGAGGLALVKDSNTWRIGRNENCEIRLQHPAVSDYHATLSCDGNRWSISDEASTAGTMVNGAKINSTFLNDEDRLDFGPVTCVIWLPSKKERKGGGKPLRWVALLIAVLALMAALGFFFALLE